MEKRKPQAPQLNIQALLLFLVSVVFLIAGFFDPTSLILAVAFGYFGFRSLAYSGYKHEVEKAERVKQELYENRIDDLKRADVRAGGKGLPKLDIDDMPELVTVTRQAELQYDKCSDFIVLDVKTTGRDPERNKIAEFAAVKFCSFEPVEYITTVVNFDNKNDKVPSIGKALPSLIDFIGDSKAIVAFNMPFIIRFLYANGFDPFLVERKYYDVLKIAKKYFDMDDYSPETLCKLYNIYCSKERCALHDCVAMGELFEEMLIDLQ